MEENEITKKLYAGEEYVNLTNAARYAGYSWPGFKNLMKRLKGGDYEIKEYTFGSGRSNYVKIADIDRALKPREVREVEG